jgi:hypothetical protein
MAFSKAHRTPRGLAAAVSLVKREKRKPTEAAHSRVSTRPGRQPPHIDGQLDIYDIEGGKDAA